MQRNVSNGNSVTIDKHFTVSNATERFQIREGKTIDRASLMIDDNSSFTKAKVTRLELRAYRCHSIIAFVCGSLFAVHCTFQLRSDRPRLR